MGLLERSGAGTWDVRMGKVADEEVGKGRVKGKTERGRERRDEGKTQKESDEEGRDGREGGEEDKKEKGRELGRGRRWIPPSPLLPSAPSSSSPFFPPFLLPRQNGAERTNLRTKCLASSHEQSKNPGTYLPDFREEEAPS